MLRKITLDKISRLDLELARSNGALVGSFRIGIEDATPGALPIQVGIALIGLLLTLPAALGIAGGFLKQASPLVLFTIAVALIVVALFWGHLVADAWACLRGITSAC